MSKKKIIIKGRPYDLDELADLVSLQKVLVPDNWPTKASVGVDLFLSVQEMAALEFKRHLAANFRTILHNAIEEGNSDGGKAVQGVSFSFEIDVTAPNVAAITKIKLGGSSKFGTTGKPLTHDLTQGTFLDDNMAVVLDVKSTRAEASAPPEEAPPESPAPDPAAGGDVTPENSPGDKVEKKKRKAK